MRTLPLGRRLHVRDARATVMLFNLSYDLTFDDFAEAMRYSPLRAKGGGGNGMFWLIIGVVVAVWISLSRAFGSPDPATIPTPPRSNMPIAEAFYVLWSVLALVIVWVFPLFIRSVRIVWQRRVMIIVACAVLAISFLLAALAGASARGPGKAPGFWGVQHDYMFFPIALFLIIAISIARYSSNRYRGLWNLNYAVTEPQTLRVLQDGIENETPFRLYRVQYIAIRQWFETPGVFVLFSGDRLTIIPKRAMGSLTETKRFRETMTVKLSGRTFAFPVQAIPVETTQTQRHGEDR